MVVFKKMHRSDGMIIKIDKELIKDKQTIIMQNCKLLKNNKLEI